MVHATCSALHCPASSRTHDVKFHQIPHDEKRRKIWLTACKRTDVIDKDWTFFKHKYVCSLHFHKCMYSKKDHLKKVAVPSLNLAAKPIQHDSSTQTEELIQYVRPYQNIEEQQYQNNLLTLNAENSSTTEDFLRDNIHHDDVKEDTNLFELDVEMKTENYDLESSEGEEIKLDIGETEILAQAQSTQPLQSVDYLQYYIHSVDEQEEIITQTKTKTSEPVKPDAEIKPDKEQKNEDVTDKHFGLETSEEDEEIKLEIRETEILPLSQSTQFLQSVLSLRDYVHHVGAKEDVITQTKSEELESYQTDEEMKSEYDHNVDGNSDLETSEEDVEIKPDIGETEILPQTYSVDSLCTQSKKSLQEIDQNKTDTIVKRNESAVSANSINTTKMPILERKIDASIQTDRVIVLSQNPDGSLSVNPEDCKCKKNDAYEMTLSQFYRSCSKFLSASFSDIVKRQVYLDYCSKQIEKQLNRAGKSVSEKLVALDFDEESASENSEKSLTDLIIENAAERGEIILPDFVITGTETAEDEMLSVNVEADVPASEVYCTQRFTNEVRWLILLNLLLKLSNKYPGKVAEDLNKSERCNLVSDDPVTCCIYFHKLVGTLMNMLKAKQSYNPFGQYFVKDYFFRIEFQHRGSPHAHILVWLNNDPHEAVSENMPMTIELVEKLSSVAKEDMPNETIYANQIHKHTFTCTKRGETTCRFGIPYWPMPATRVLVPMPQTDGRRSTFQKKSKELRTCLSERTYPSMDDFLREHGLTFDAYLDIVRSTLRRPTLLFKRNFDQLMTNTFNPYLAGQINSNIDIQFILDEYSCAQYVVEYVNKSGNLNRELT